MKSEYSTAIHEAAHAVAAIEFNLNLRYVTIIPDEIRNSLGHMKKKLKKSAFTGIDVTYEHTPKVEQHLKHEMICSFAGQAAEARYLKIPFNFKNAFIKIEGGYGDLKNFHEIAERLHPDTKVLQAYYNYILEEARLFVSIQMNWKVIKAIANELMKKKRLSKKECLAISQATYRKDMETYYKKKKLS